MNADSPRTKVSIIWALSKHAQHIQHMRCGSKATDALLLLEAVWQFLPSLQRLDVELPLEAVRQDPHSILRMPDSLQNLQMHVIQHSCPRAMLAHFTKYGPKLRKLVIDASKFSSTASHGGGYGYGYNQPRQCPSIVFGNTDLPSLDSMRLMGSHTFEGRLLASNLVHISITNDTGISWKNFDECRRLSTVQLASCKVDFTGSNGASLASVQRFCIEGGIIQEDGAFQGLDASRLISLNFQISNRIPSTSFTLKHLHVEKDLTWSLEASGGYTIFNALRG